MSVGSKADRSHDPYDECESLVVTNHKDLCVLSFMNHIQRFCSYRCRSTLSQSILTSWLSKYEGTRPPPLPSLTPPTTYARVRQAATQVRR